LRELAAISRLFIAAAGARRPDVVISTSSPPGLLIIAVMIATLRRAPSVHWALDLYPELAFRLGEGWPKPVMDFFYQVVGRAYRQSRQIVTLEDDMRTHLRIQYGVDASIIRPWVLQSGLPQLAPYPEKIPFYWIYSGNLGRAHEWKTMLEAQYLLEARGLPISLIIQGGGAVRPLAEKTTQTIGLRNVIWKPYVADSEVVESLLTAHVFVVTQKLSVRGLLWPSKLGLLKKLPRPLVFIGPPKGAIAAEVNALPNGAAFGPDENERLAGHIEKLFGSWPPEASPMVDSSDDFAAAYQSWKDIIQAAVRRT
jgi:hypothetical protein